MQSCFVNYLIKNLGHPVVFIGHFQRLLKADILSSEVFEILTDAL